MQLVPHLSLSTLGLRLAQLGHIEATTVPSVSVAALDEGDELRVGPFHGRFVFYLLDLAEVRLLQCKLRGSRTDGSAIANAASRCPAVKPHSGLWPAQCLLVRSGKIIAFVHHLRWKIRLDVVRKFRVREVVLELFCCDALGRVGGGAHAESAHNSSKQYSRESHSRCG